MPYGRIPEFASSVTDHGPKHVQEIYKEAFNMASDQDGDL